MVGAVGVDPTSGAAPDRPFRLFARSGEDTDDIAGRPERLRVACRGDRVGGGWLGRWITQANTGGILPVLATGPGSPDSLSGARDVAVAQALEGLIVGQGHGLASVLRRRLTEGFGAHRLIGAPVGRLIEFSGSLEARIPDKDAGDVSDYVPAVSYPENDLAQAFKTVARAIKLDLGLRVATVDFGGWDTHINQAEEFPRLVDNLRGVIQSFWRNLAAHQDRTSLVVMREFGRRLRSNTAGGTDHGYGNVMMVAGAGRKGGECWETGPDFPMMLWMRVLI